VLLDTLADAASAAAVAVAGAVIALTGRFFWLDPVLALAIAVVIAGPAGTLSLKAIGAIRGRAVVSWLAKVASGIPVTDEPKEYPQYWPGYYAVFFDDPINGIHWELAWLPKVPTAQQLWSFYRAIRAFARSRPDSAKTVPGVAWQARRTLRAG